LAFFIDVFIKMKTWKADGVWLVLHAWSKLAATTAGTPI
jgi:hypothetical protein